jgi:hypothetical protein
MRVRVMRKTETAWRGMPHLVIELRLDEAEELGEFLLEPGHNEDLGIAIMTGVAEAKEYYDI